MKIFNTECQTTHASLVSRRSLLAVSFLVMQVLAVTDAFAVTFSKTFYLSGAAAKDKIQAGAEVDTWAGATLFNGTKNLIVNSKGRVVNKVKYLHSNVRTMGTTKLSVPALAPFGARLEGLPVSTNGLAEAFVLAPGAAPANSLLATTAPHVDNHTKPNSGSVSITASKLTLVPLKYKKRKGGKVKTITNYVKVGIEGFATAGKPTRPADTDKAHSADAFGAAYIKGTKNYLYNGFVGNFPILKRVSKYNVGGGGFGTAGLKTVNKAVDPTTVTLVNVTDGTEVSKTVMEMSVSSANGTFTMDDTGIRLAVNKNDPDSIASINFTSDFDWVVDPYVYGATLTTSGGIAGFSSYGETLGGWSFLETNDVIEAFYEYVDGVLFEEVEVLPLSDLVTGKTYRYESGDGVGAYSVASVVPIPTAAYLFGSGLLGLIGVAKRKKT